MSEYWRVDRPKRSPATLRCSTRDLGFASSDAGAGLGLRHQSREIQRLVSVATRTSAGTARRTSLCTTDKLDGVRRSPVRTMVCVLGLAFLLNVVTGQAAAGDRTCGKLHGGQVVLLRGAVSCSTARRVLAYGLTRFSGNGPASPPGWNCFRISGDPRYNGNECQSPPNASRPQRWIQLRFPLTLG
jgi:hypothetical protein